MDPETEKHFAALIMEEAARLRLRADKEGVHAYLAKPNVRGRPNPQFLKATVRGIEQANRAVEISGMWKRRALELELEERDRKRSRHYHRSHTNSRSLDRSSHSYHSETKRAKDKSNTVPRNSYQASSLQRLQNKNAFDSASEDTTSCCNNDDHVQTLEDDFRDQGLREEEIDQFLHSRIKRGRGAVGSRMDDTGPYPSAHCLSEDHSDVRVKEEWEQRIIGPSLEFGERHLIDAKQRRTKKDQVDQAECTSDHMKKKREKKKKKHRSLHKKSKKKDDAL